MKEVNTKAESKIVQYVVEEAKVASRTLIPESLFQKLELEAIVEKSQQIIDVHTFPTFPFPAKPLGESMADFSFFASKEETNIGNVQNFAKKSRSGWPKAVGLKGGQPHKKNLSDDQIANILDNQTPKKPTKKEKIIANLKYMKDQTEKEEYRKSRR